MPLATFVDAGLDKLDLALASIATNDTQRARVTRRLQALLAKLDNTQTDTTDENDLDAATDDEMFSLIDRELGQS